MSIYAYTRVSDKHSQDESQQLSVINNYAAKNNLTVSKFIGFNISGSKSTTAERGIDDLLAKLNTGDIVLISDIARLGRDDIHTILNIITSITGKGAELHFCYSDTTITPDDKNDISKVFIAIGEAFAAVKFAEERSRKATVACEIRKSKGLHNGREKGAVITSKLDSEAAYILTQLKAGTAKTAILRGLKNKGITTSRSNLYTWIEKRTV